MEEQERQEVLIEGSKKESKALRWTQKASAPLSEKKSRPVLTGIRILDGIAVACDGFRLHAIQRPESLENEFEATLVGKIPAGKFVAKMEVVEGRYPDYEAVMPDSEPTFEIAVNAKYLRDALQGFDGAVMLKFWADTKPMEILGSDKNGTPRYALIMPMFIDKGRARGNWRPEISKPAEEEGEGVEEAIEDLNDES